MCVNEPDSLDETNIRRFLILGEETENAVLPEWYKILRLAQYLHISPMELENIDPVWGERALIAIQAEKDAHQTANGA